MHISATLMLIVGIVAFALFLLLLVGCWVITMRNRRTILRSSRQK